MVEAPCDPTDTAEGISQRHSISTEALFSLSVAFEKPLIEVFNGRIEQP